MEIRKRKLRITFLYLALLCLLIGSISTYVYTRISKELSGTSGMFDFSRIFGGESENIRGIRAAVLRSEQTADFLVWLAGDTLDEIIASGATPPTPEETRSNYYAMSAFWLKQLEANNIRGELIDEATLLSDDMERFNLLILPATYCLSDEQIEAVKVFLTLRKSVIFTHFTGNRHADGGDRPWSLSADVVGAELSHPPTDRLAENAVQLIFAGDNPIAADVAPGLLLPINTYDNPIAARIRDENRAFPAAVWPDASGNLPMKPKDRAAVAYGEYRGGRFVWFGFTAQSVQSGPRHWPYYGKLIQNALYWAGRQPTAGRSPWPGGHAAAATIGVVTRNGFFEPSRTENLLRAANIPHAVFVPPGGAQMPASLIRSPQRVEVGLLDSPGFMNQIVEPEAISRLNTELSRFDSQWDASVEGLALNETPLNLLEATDYLRFQYLWLTDRPQFAPLLVSMGRGTSRPFFSRVPAPLAVIGQSARSDSQLTQRQRLAATDVNLFTEDLVRDLERVRNIGGLYSITLNPQFSDLFAENPTIRAWTDALGSNRIWKAKPAEIASWWKQYSEVKLQISQDGARFTLRMSNEGNEPIPEIRILIYPGILPERLEIRSERMRTPIPDYRIQRELKRIELIVTDLKERENRTYYVDF